MYLIKLDRNMIHTSTISRVRMATNVAKRKTDKMTEIKWLIDERIKEIWKVWG